MLRAHKTRIRNANPGSSIARALAQHDGATPWAYNALLARLNDATQASPAGALWPSGDDLETRPESQLAGFSTASERRNTVVHDVFVHAMRFNHP